MDQNRIYQRADGKMISKHVNTVAHRGYSGLYPENTEIAFRKALELGVEMIEFDVHLARDESLIIIHDDTVDRTSDGKGPVAEMSLQEIKSLDAGSWMGRSFSGVRFITLGEALDIVGGKTRLNVHIKAGDDDRDRVIPLVTQELKRRNLLSSCFVASDQESIVLARKTIPEIAICNLTTEPSETYIERSLSIGCTILQPKNDQVSGSFVEEAHSHNLEVNPFFADDRDEMKRLIACGVDGILTNRPDRLKETIGLL